MQDDITWCVSRAKAIPRCQNAFRIADMTTYIVGIIAFTLVIICTYLLTTFEKKPIDLVESVIVSMQVLLGSSTVLNRIVYVHCFLVHSNCTFLIV